MVMSASPEERHPTITVTGVGLVDTDPDRVELHLVLTADDPNRQAAFQQVATRSQRLEKLLDSLKIPSDRRHTTGIDLQEIRYPERKPVSYRAEAGMWVQLAPDGPVTTLLTRAVEEVGASVGGLGWYLSPEHPAHLEAVRKAGLEARTLAEAAAGALGLSVASVVDIRLLGRPGFRRFAMAAALRRMAKPAEPNVEPGSTSATAEVEVTFRLEPNAEAVVGAASNRDPAP